MLLIKLKSKFNCEILSVFANGIANINNQYDVDLASTTDINKLEEHGYEPSFDNLYLSLQDFNDYVKSIESI